MDDAVSSDQNSLFGPALQFSKYQGLGNDFLLLDGRSLRDGEVDAAINLETIRNLCHRRFGVGADGVILALPPRQGGDLRMRIFNADGSEPEMCGNGIRCLARFLADSDGDGEGRSWQIETLAGRIVPELQADGQIRVNMGRPVLDPESVPTSLAVGNAGLPQGLLEVGSEVFAVAAAGMGNPHVVIPVVDVAGVDLETLGPLLETHPAFPARTNVHFVQVVAPTHLVMRVWERGAGPTLACGTGACATLVACHLLGLCDASARVDLPGGSLLIEWPDVSGSILMTGPARAVFDGVLAPAPPARGAAPAQRHSTASGPESGIDCATACGSGCLRPEACASAEARARVEALIEGLSLDELVAIASHSAAARGHDRMQGDGQGLG